MYMYMYMYMYRCICIYAYVCIHMYKCTTHAHPCAYRAQFTHMHTHTHIHAHAHAHAHAHTCACHAHLLLRCLEHAELLSLDSAHGGLPGLVCVCWCVSERVYIPCRASVRMCPDVQNVFCLCVSECIYIPCPSSVRDALLRTHTHAHTNQQIHHPADTSRHSSACVD
jgi:hypothetical protein